MDVRWDSACGPLMRLCVWTSDESKLVDIWWDSVCGHLMRLCMWTSDETLCEDIWWDSAYVHLMRLCVWTSDETLHVNIWWDSACGYLMRLCVWTYNETLRVEILWDSSCGHLMRLCMWTSNVTQHVNIWWDSVCGHLMRLCVWRYVDTWLAGTTINGYAVYILCLLRYHLSALLQLPQGPLSLLDNGQGILKWAALSWFKISKLFIQVAKPFNSHDRSFVDQHWNFLSLKNLFIIRFNDWKRACHIKGIIGCEMIHIYFGCKRKIGFVEF